MTARLLADHPKTLLPLLFTLLLTALVSVAVPASAQPIPSVIRVGLQSCVGHPSSITVKANEPLTVTDLDTKAVIAEVEAGREVTIHPRGKVIEVKAPVPQIAPETVPEPTLLPDTSDQPDAPEPATEEPAEAPAPPTTFKGPIRIATKTSEGIIEIVSPKLRYKHYREVLEVRGGSKLSVINELSVEHYVYGVTPTEIPASFQPEAQKALVVAARTYSIRNCERHKADSFNMCDSVHCQGFAGADREAEWVRKIVDATRGEVITCNGEPIYALYSADCGGMTQSGEDSGMVKTGYLKSVSDNVSGEACVVVEKKVAGSTETVASDQSDQSDASDEVVQPEETTCPTPAMTEFEKPATGDFCGTSRVHCWTRTYSAADLEKVFSRSSSTRVGKLTSMEFAEYDGSGRVRTILLKGDAGEKHLSGARFRDLFGLSTIMSTRMALTVTPEGKYVIEGRGFGHGVGLCQWGANGMAKSSKDVTYIDILKHYYTGVEITKTSEQ